MKNITLSADPLLIEQARKVARSRNTSLNTLFREWLSGLVDQKEREKQIEEDLHNYLNLVLWPRCTVFPSPEIYAHALKVQQMTQYRFDDALIVSSALASGASVLYSEDLQTGRRFDSLMIQSPFESSLSLDTSAF